MKREERGKFKKKPKNFLPRVTVDTKLSVTVRTGRNQKVTIQATETPFVPLPPNLGNVSRKK
jgi:hypothetical protein